MIGIIMFFASLVMLLYGFPVAFTFAAVSLLFGVIAGIVFYLFLFLMLKFKLDCQV